jgi:hypothetical protein
MVAARKQAQEAMKQAQELLGRKMDHRPYPKGQWVWLEGKHLQTTHPSVKMRPKRFGPFQITESIGKTNYRLDIPSHWKIHNAFHANLLLSYQETQEHGHNFTDPPPELIEGQEEWEVEQILDRRIFRCKEQYLIKWKGYSDVHNSWEPKENIWAPVLLLAFKNKEGHKPRHQKHAKAIVAKLHPRTHMGAKIKRKEAPSTGRIAIRALHLGQEREVRSKDKAPSSLHNTHPPTLPHCYNHGLPQFKPQNSPDSLARLPKDLLIH